MALEGTAGQDDLQCLVSKGIQLWGTTQEVLEEQALKELEILVKDEPPDDDELLPIASTSSQEEQEEIKIEVKEEPLYQPSYEEDEEEAESGSDYVPSEDEGERPKMIVMKKKKLHSYKRQKKTKNGVIDDALKANYKARLGEYYKRLETELETLGVASQSTKDYKKLKGGLKVPNEVWDKLYEYQKEGVFWLWELHQRTTGGLLGDEMGLGKTVQIIVFLHALQYSGYLSQHCRYKGVGPTIIVCPATVIHQWVKHFHEWAPEFRIVILHQSGSHQGQKSQLIREANKNKSILITTYQGILKYKGHLVEYNWQYLVLDEGHKIRNPTAKVTIAVQEIRTPHRIMLTGSPMQNNLTELWSLFDFTNPGMLGTLATFTEHFTNPILQGGFTNASPMQEATALSVATTLKNVISPFLLRRMKSEVKDHIKLPHKHEQVLFCSLTDEQRDIYKDYLMSEQVNNVLGRGVKSWRSDNFMRANMLMAITALRKICNHPDLFIHDEKSKDDSLEGYGYYKRSGKMVVVSALLKIWKKQGHRTLLFSQGRSMVRIFQHFLEQQHYKYLKMDGGTNISSRQSLIDKFNQDSTYNVFLLTTRVGGLGVNLTGANRVIIYDPDWNPATDSQARERAWRIGQDKSVTIYRLLCAGTIEEKMYQRQIWKQLLSNKVLIDPSTNKFFKSSNLFDLFSMPDSQQQNNPESMNIFRESRVKMQSKKKLEEDNNKVEFSEDKIQAMKEMAQKIAKSLSNTNQNIKSPQMNPYQVELEEERKQKLKNKEKLKQLSPQELVEYNRWRASLKEDTTTNKLDDKVATTLTFDEALENSSKTAKIYHKLTSGQIKQSDLKKMKIESKKRKRELSPKVDTSGKIDGEKVEGLVKREKKKLASEHQSSSSSGEKNNFILEHLFSKKGVAGALEHESVLNGGKKNQSLKVRTYADERALKSLDALKQSRVKNWKW